jgi:hypothetical protein
MNTNNKNKSTKPRRFHLLLTLTLLVYPILSAPTISEASAARMLHTSSRVEYAMANTPRAQTYQPGGIKVLAEGFHSKITKPFVAVVRDTETYAALRKLDGNLPKLDADFFEENVVVAAFLGERHTGGYSVEITPNAIEINVLEKKPGKGVMVPQMITSPFKIVSLHGATNAAVRLNLFVDETWLCRYVRRIWTARCCRGDARREARDVLVSDCRFRNEEKATPDGVLYGPDTRRKHKHKSDEC